MLKISNSYHAHQESTGYNDIQHQMHCCCTSHGVWLQAKYSLYDAEIGPNILKVNDNGHIMNL